MEDLDNVNSNNVSSEDAGSSSQGKSCALCGCATPAVRCDRCNSQIFCLSCDDMYHKHPKRKFHLRKAVESIWASARSPRFRRRTDLPGDPSKIPIPPPRSKKRERHTLSGRLFMKSGLELGSFGHSKVFDAKSLMPNRDFYNGQKSPTGLVGTNCDDASSPSFRNESPQIYENDNITNQDAGLDTRTLNDRSPWNQTRPNIASPIQVSIPSNSPDINMTNGQTFGYPAKPQSQSISDLPGHPQAPIGHHPYHFHPPYPYMHPAYSMAHLNCPQCLSSSWSNLMSPHPSPFFHPLPWGSAQSTLARQPFPGAAGPMKHSHGDLVSYPDSSFQYPYPGYYPNRPPMVDPNFIRNLHEQAELQKQKKPASDSKPSSEPEEMDTAVGEEAAATSEAATSGQPTASTRKDANPIDEEPVKPQKPLEPWECVHCTFINPPGDYICQVCCKTSYGNEPSDAHDADEARPMSRDSESPLVNRDALLNSPDHSGYKEAQKVN